MYIGAKDRVQFARGEGRRVGVLSDGIFQVQFVRRVISILKERRGVNSIYTAWWYWEIICRQVRMGKKVGLTAEKKTGGISSDTLCNK